MTGKTKERVRIIMFIILLLVILLSIPLARCQDLPMPPKLTVHTQPACHVVTHGVAWSTDAKTGLTLEVFRYRAEPSAQTGKGKPWTLPKERVAHSNLERPGALVDAATLGEAVQACGDWLSAVRVEQEKLLIAKGRD